SGDTLFSGSIGRTDLWGGDPYKIIKSIKERLLKLDDDTVVIPGHGENTKIYNEKKFNPFL
ncbi:MAG: MBL fold metallo-hydrolase, partial [Leptospiraceae bacterium]|nr:MBL fold metallo-hydrolase [Leptospiraceae bacterium]